MSKRGGFNTLMDNLKGNKKILAYRHAVEINMNINIMQQALQVIGVALK